MSLTTYGTRHAQALFGSLGRLARSPFATFLTVLVIGLALALPLALELLVSNARTLTSGVANAIDVSVYFRQGVPLAKVRELAAQARQHPGIGSVTVISADDGLKEFREYSGFGAALQALQENPLPHVLHVRPTAEAMSPGALAALRGYLAGWSEVDTVQVDAGWVQRLNAIVDLLKRVLLVSAVVLGVGVLAMVGNTVRLEIQNRRAEIEVVKLVGGSNAFVRRPFLYTGVLYGLAGALIAWIIIAVAVLVLERPIASLAALYGSRYVLAGPAGREVLALLGIGAVLGWLGAWVSSTRHLRRIAPRA
ncbi:MAG TPA: permease-like cell division protein FtsX [Steroidobacteraceae bacterium]|nr:permease-like cell division protein FtsX [Steroidobacteraceae bacterium]